MQPTFEIGPRATLSEDQVQTILGIYHLGEPIEKRDLGGAFNLNLKVVTARGSHIIRVYRPWVTPERLAFITYVKEHLRQANLPVPITIAVISGNVVGMESTRMIEIEAFTEHHRHAASWSQYIDAFGMLGRLHSVLAEVDLTDRYVAPQVRNYGLPQDQLVWLQHTKRRLAALPQSRQRDDALKLVADTRQLLETIDHWWQQTDARLPAQLVHGDYGGENILFRRGAIIALLDFDLTSIHERVYEIAYSLYWMLARLSGHPHASHWEWSQVQPCLRAYQSRLTGELHSGELESIPLEMARVPLYWIAEAGWTDDPLQGVLRLRQHIENARWIAAHVDTLPIS